MITDEQRKAALDDMDAADYDDEVFWEKHHKTIRAALQTPHPYYGPCDALANGLCAECLKQTPRVPVFEGLDEAIYVLKDLLVTNELHDRDKSRFKKIIEAARWVAEQNKGRE